MIARSFDRLVARSLDRPFARSLGRSLARPLGRLVDQLLGRSIVWEKMLRIVKRFCLNLGFRDKLKGFFGSATPKHALRDDL